MNRQSAEELKSQILSEVGRAELRKGAQLQSLARQRPSDQLAVGFSRGAGSSAGYEIELRVQRPDGNAFDVAQDYRDKFPNEVRLLVVPRVDLLPYLGDLSRPSSKAKLPSRRPADRRVLRLGLSVSRLDNEAGTLGAFLRVKGEDDHFLLSCNHVLAKLNAGRTGDDIYHPGKPDQKPLGNRFRVARFDQCIDLVTNDVNQSDAAIARLNPDVDHSGTVIPEGAPNAGQRLAAFRGDPIGDIRLGQPVRMVGRTSGPSSGSVTAVGLGPQPVNTPLGKMLFSEVIEVVGDNGKPFSDAGDSGSLVFLSDTFDAVGLVFAGGPVEKEEGKKITVSYLCLLSEILSYFDAKLV